MRNRRAFFYNVARGNEDNQELGTVFLACCRWFAAGRVLSASFWIGHLAMF